jgi:hypothetical protein
MTEKLTPEEIKKALECIQPRILTEKERMAIENALDLINRQQAEVEEMHKRVMRLDSEREEWSRSATTEKLKNIELQAEIERLQNDLAISRKETKRYATRRAEAIKEFAEKLKDYLRKQPKWSCRREKYDNVGFTYDDVFFGIDKVVKEMVGEQDV